MLSGHSGICSFRQVVAGYSEGLSREQIWRKHQRQFKRLGEEAGLVHWQTPDGDYWTPPNTDLYFLVAEQVLDIYTRGSVDVKAGDVVLDCGANVGTFTRKALRKGARLVVAIEPSPSNVAALRITFAQEIEQRRVIVYPKGVWNKDDVLSMWVYQNSALDSFVMRRRTEEANKPVEVRVPLTTIDRIVTELALDRVDFLKMDVEGSERAALVGARSTISRYRPRMAIAAENLTDDQYEVPKAVSAAYNKFRLACTTCTLQDGEVRPDVLYFDPY